MSTSVASPLASTAPPDRYAVLRVIAPLALVCLALWPTWVSYPVAWLDNRLQGFLVAVFCLWLIWRNRQQLAQVENGFTLASVPIMMLSLAWLAGLVLNVQVVHHAAVPLMLLLWTLGTLGFRSFLMALPITLAFFLAVPIWGLMIPGLQALTVAANTAMLAVTGLEAEISGTYIAIPEGTFEVAAGCSGANYLESGLLIGAVYSLLFLRSWKARVVSVVLVAMLALMSNWLRVYGLILIGHYTNMQSSLIREHNLYGWVIFACALGLFFVLVRRIEAYDDTQAAEGRGSERSLIGLSTPARDASSVTRPTPLFPTLSALVGPALLLMLGTSEPNQPVPSAPTGIAPRQEWTRLASDVLPVSASSGGSPVSALARAAGDSPRGGNELPGSQGTREWMPLYTGADVTYLERWHSTDAEIALHRLVYLTQSQGKELIDGSNVLVADSVKLRSGLAGPLDEYGRMVNATVIRSDSGPQLIWSWFVVAGYPTHSRAEAKLLELIAFARGGQPSELIALRTACGDDAECRTASRTLYEFVMGRDALPTPAPR